MLIDLERWPHGSLNEQGTLQPEMHGIIPCREQHKPKRVLWIKDSLRVWKGTQ